MTEYQATSGLLAFYEAERIIFLLERALMTERELLVLVPVFVGVTVVLATAAT